MQASSDSYVPSQAWTILPTSPNTPAPPTILPHPLICSGLYSPALVATTSAGLSAGIPYLYSAVIVFYGTYLVLAKWLPCRGSAQVELVHERELGPIFFKEA